MWGHIYMRKREDKEKKDKRSKNIVAFAWCDWALRKKRSTFLESSLTTITSNQYEEEYGLILYNATWILDNQSNFIYSKFLYGWK